MKQLGYVAQDQHGNTYYIGDNPPRRWLLNYFGRQYAVRIIREQTGSKAQHVGYIIAGFWLMIYRVCAWK